MDPIYDSHRHPGKAPAPKPRLARYLPLLEDLHPFLSHSAQPYVQLPSSTAFHVRSQEFRDWFYHHVFRRTRDLPTSHAFRSVILHLEAQARLQDQPVWRRVAQPHPSHLALDLHDGEGHHVTISPQGWSVTTDPNIAFEASRLSGDMPAPSQPQPDDSPLDLLQSLLQLPRPDWLRCLAWLLSAFRPHGPFPFLLIQGPIGSGKSLTARFLRTLVDRSYCALVPTPRHDRDLFDLVRHHWVLAFDGVRSLRPDLADTLCRLTSCAGLAGRDLVPSAIQQESFRRPILLTTTDSFSCPAEMKSRALTLNLPARDSYRTEDDLIATFSEAYPRILGGLCSALSMALRRYPDFRSATTSSRLADALAWAMAAAPALGCTEQEMRDAFGPDLPPNPIVPGIAGVGKFNGSATDLKTLLPESIQPQSPKGVSQLLHKSELALADAGIEVEFTRLPGGKKQITLQHVESPIPETPIPNPESPVPSPHKDATQNFDECSQSIEIKWVIAMQNYIERQQALQYAASLR